jgi:hypothetical protein
VPHLDAIANWKGAEIRDYVYSRIGTGMHTSKETAMGRFRDLDEITASPAISDDLNIIHYIAVSSGVTSLELYRVLESRRFPLNFYVSDKHATYGSTGSALIRIVDADQKPVEMYVCGVLAKRNLTNCFFLARFLYSLLADVGAHHPFRWFPLLGPAIMEQIDRGRIQQLDYDVFETRMPAAFTFVRCMNLLNLSYFTPSRIVDALHNIVAPLKEGGGLQIGRTMPDGRNTVGFHRKTRTGLSVLKEVGGGTELRDVVGRFRA